MREQNASFQFALAPRVLFSHELWESKSTQNCFVHPNMAAKSTAFPWEFRIAGEVDHHFQHPDTEKDRHPARASPRGVCGILHILRYTSLSTSFHIHFLLVVKLCKRTHPQLVHRQNLHGSPWISKFQQVASMAFDPLDKTLVSVGPGAQLALSWRSASGRSRVLATCHGAKEKMARSVNGALRIGVPPGTQDNTQQLTLN